LNDLFDEVLSGHPPVFRYIFYNEANKVCGSINQRFLSFVQGGLFSDAAALVKSFIENADVSSTLNYNLGQLYNSLGQFRAAFPYAFQAARQKKDYRDALDLLGGLYFRIGDFDRSVEYYERAREQSPEDPVSNFHLALALKVKGKDVEAEKLFLEAIRNENVGLRQEKKAQTEPPKSTLDYSLTIREEAITFFARMKLGEIALARREFDQAGVHFNEAARMSPKSPEPYYELARLYSISVQSEKIKYYLGLYLSLGGDEAKARALLEKK
ncbi:MAG: tetratricopeptide repeat protein, partial [Candidatus Aminicenantes bacterium]|nr:tetratricopeptide repeat protein [Candidatus Aminicenantes bacterium]